MRAEIVIGHSCPNDADLRSRLETQFGAHDPEELKRSPIYGPDAAYWARIFSYVHANRGCRIMFMPKSSGTLQATVEPIEDKITESCEFVWKESKKALKGRRPRLAKLELVDDTSKREFLSARTGFKSEISRRETGGPLLVACLLLLYYGAALLTFAKEDGWKYAAGLIAGLATALVAVIFAIWEVRKGVLRWAA